MARLNTTVAESKKTGSSSGGPGFSIPYRAIAVSALAVAAIVYLIRIYTQLNPNPGPIGPPVGPKKAGAAATRKSNPVPTWSAQLALTEDQRTKLSDIVKKTTNTAVMRRELAKILTPEQTAKFNEITNKNKKPKAPASSTSGSVATK